MIDEGIVRLWDHGLGVLPGHCAGDKGYDAKSNREHLLEAGIQPVLAQRKTTRRQDAPFDKTVYRKRNIVERMVGWFKRYRRVATRFDKLAVSFGATIQVATVLRLLRMSF